jgi:hypothetical protein
MTAVCSDNLLRIHTGPTFFHSSFVDVSISKISNWSKWRHCDGAESVISWTSSRDGKLDRQEGNADAKPLCKRRDRKLRENRQDGDYATKNREGWHDDRLLPWCAQ